MKVAVVGAGISGLRAAMLLESQGETVTVFEARRRIGGRLWTADEGGGAIYEAGGEWIDSDQPRMKALTHQFAGGLDVAVREPALAIFRGEVKRTDDLWQELLEDETRIEHSARALASELTLPAWTNRKFELMDIMDLDGFVKQNCVSEEGYWWMNANLRSDEGDDLTNIGLLGWLVGYTHYLQRENLNRGESEMSAYRVPGGFSAMLQKMREGLNGEVILGVELSRINQDASGVTLHFGDSAERFDRVILTLPPRCLEHIVFEPALTVQKRCAIEAFGMSRAVKLVFEFDSPWWNDLGFCGRFHCDGALQQMWEGARGSAPILSAYICGERAVEWTRLGDPVTAGIYELSQIFPQARDHFKRGFFHDWINDPHSLGAFSHYRPGFVLDHSEHIIQPEGRTHFAGEHTATWLGYAEGALESAERVVLELA
jgi:monoamine oxidase